MKRVLCWVLYPILFAILFAIGLFFVLVDWYNLRKQRR